MECQSSEPFDMGNTHLRSFTSPLGLLATHIGVLGLKCKRVISTTILQMSHKRYRSASIWNLVWQGIRFADKTFSLALVLLKISLHLKMYIIMVINQSRLGIVLFC